MFRNDGNAPRIEHIAITGYVVFAIPRFLAAARDVAVVLDSRMGGDCLGVLFPMLPGVCLKGDDIGPLKVICASDFDLVAFSVAYSQSFQVYWAWIESAQCRYSY